MRFVGAERVALVGILRDAYAAAVEARTLRVEVVEAPDGWGRTRILRELYGQLALLQRHPPYWPPAVDGRYPVAVSPPPGARPDLLWLALHGLRVEGVPRFAVLDADAQVSAHAAGIAQALRDGDQLWRRRVGLAVKALGLLPGLGVAGELLDLLEKGADARELALALPAALATRSGLLDRAYERQAGRTLDVSGTERAQEAADATADALAAVSRLLPLALVVDDADELDPVTVRFLDALPRRGAVGLVVLAGRPGVLPDLLGSRHRLPRLDAASLGVLAASLAPGRPDLAELVTAADGNPAVLTGLLTLPPGAAPVPGTGLRGLYEALWEELPVDTRRRLAALSLLGSEAPERWLAELVPGDPAVPGWTELPEPGVVRFTEAVRYAVATQMRDTVTGRDLVDQADRMVTAARGTDHWTNLPASVREALLSSRDADPDAAAELARLRLASGRPEAAAALLAALADGTGAVAVTSAAVLFETNRVQAAIDRLEAEHDRLVAAGSPDALVARHNLAALLAAAGRTDEAVDAYRELVTERVAALGPSHEHTRAARRDLARVLAVAHRPADAVAEFEELYDADVDALGPEHPDTLSDANDLFLQLVEAGRPREAAAELAGIRPAVERVHGPDSIDALTVRTNLAVALGSAGPTDQAVPQLEAVAGEWELRAGPWHPRTLRARSVLASAYRRGGRPADAVRLHREVLARWQERTGPDSPQAHRAAYELAGALSRTGRSADAVPLFEQAVAGLPADDRVALAAAAGLGTALLDAGRTAEAVDRLRSAAEATERAYGPDQPGTLAVRHDLGLALNGAHRPAESVPLLTDVLDRSRAVFGPGTAEEIRVRQTLLVAYLHDGMPIPRAVPIIEAIAAEARDRLGPDHEVTRAAEQDRDLLRSTLDS